MPFTPGGSELPKQVKTAFGARGILGLSIAEEIVPVIDFGPDAPPPFHTKRGGAVAINIAANVGNIGTAAIANPLGSGKIVVLRRIRFISQATTGLRTYVVLPYLRSNGGLTDLVVTPIRPWDFAPGTTESTAVIGQGSNTAVMFPGSRYDLVTCPDGTNHVSDFQYVLREDRGIAVQSFQTNVICDVAFYWDEFDRL